MRKFSLALRFRKKLFKLLKSHVTTETLIGYENPTLVNEIVKKTLIRSQQIKNGEPLEISEVRILLGMPSINSPSLVVVDFGGGAGTHFDVFSTIYPEIDFHYFIIETPEMVRTASSNRSKDTNLYFLTLDELDKLPESIDLLVANSSLQYSKSPIETLTTLCELAHKSLWITRFPLNDKEDSITIRQVSKLEDNGPGRQRVASNQFVEYASKIVSMIEFERELEKKFKVTMKVVEERNPYGSDYQSINSYGFLAKIKK
jgi:putative methyltransferase (TIGR04325 family)